MATYPCDLCGRGPAEFLIGATLTGDQMSVGAECILKWAKEIDKAFKAATREANDPRTTDVAALDPPDQMAVIMPTDDPDVPQEAPTVPDGDWEAGYPEGRPAGPEAAPETPSDDVGADTQEAAPTGHGG